MNHTELAKLYSLEEIVALNNLLDFLLEHDYRRTKSYLEQARAEGEIIEQIIFEQMMNKPTRL